MTNVQCPSCGKIHQADESILGTQVTCNDCGATFVAQPTAPQPVPGAYQPVGGGTSVLKPLLITGGVLVGLAAIALLVIFVIVPLVGGGSPSWTKAYVPEDVRQMSYLNLDGLRKGKLGDDADKLLTLPRSFKVEAGDLAEMFSARGKNVTMMAFRTQKAMDLDKFLSNVDSGDIKEYEKLNYAKAGFDGYVAKMDDRTFCLVRSEDDLKDMMKQVASGKKPKMADDMAECLDAVGGLDVFCVKEEDGTGDDPKAFGMGCDVGSSMDVKAHAVYKDSDQAEEQRKQFDEELDKVKKRVEDMPSGDDKDRAEKQLDFMKKLTPSRSGKVLKISFSASKDELKDLMPMADDPMLTLAREVSRGNLFR